MGEDCRYGIHDISRTELDETSGLPRYQKFISDIAGQDIFVHNNNAEEVVRVVRNWLLTVSDRQTIPSGSIIWKHYQDFLEDLPQLTQKFQLEIEDLKFFKDYIFVVVEWLNLQSNSKL